MVLTIVAIIFIGQTVDQPGIGHIESAKGTIRRFYIIVISKAPSADIYGLGLNIAHVNGCQGGRVKEGLLSDGGYIGGNIYGFDFCTAKNAISNALQLRGFPNGNCFQTFATVKRIDSNGCNTVRNGDFGEL